MSNNGSKPTYVEPQQPVAAVVLEEAPDEKLTAEALESIRGTERLSSFGRFASKFQNVFQTTKPYGKAESAHLKAAPIMMSVGLLLLLATGLLFLLSKPESAVHSHFRQPTGLSGTDDHKLSNTPNTDSAVTESQLAGGETSNDAQMASRANATRRAQQEATARRFAFADEGGGSGAPSASPTQATISELQTPATVFVGNAVSNPALAPVGYSPNVRQDQNQAQLPSGTEIIAHTTNAISSGLESPVIAVVDRNVQLGDQIVIPQGSRVIGYTAGAVKDRINVRFTSLILPNSRREITVSGLALMKDGSAGLVGRVQGSGHPILAGAGRVATGASVLAIQFGGQNNQPFSQADYLRNQLASEVANEGSRYSNRLQQPMNVPIVTVNTNQPIRIFLLNGISISEGHISPRPTQQTDTNATTAEQNQSPDQALATAQTAYIQALEAQLADARAALTARNANGRR
jgi:type IV secretory pathway VirB10-like protein